MMMVMMMMLSVCYIHVYTHLENVLAYVYMEVRSWLLILSSISWKFTFWDRASHQTQSSLHSLLPSHHWVPGRQQHTGLEFQNQGLMFVQRACYSRGIALVSRKHGDMEVYIFRGRHCLFCSYILFKHSS